MPNVARENELEQALHDLIDYMKAMPRSPATHHAIQKAEAVIQKAGSIQLLEAVSMTPAGIVPIAARIYGKSLLLKSSDTRNLQNIWPTHKEFLHRQLADGYLLKLQPPVGRGLHLFEPDIQRQIEHHNSIAD
ncbi:hypothetical protein [Herbaspirillum huttiense]|uniref:hypothetical protein n=1 Tax=Herbaspirillum huttiense TaxID=863372 RepID=UPI0039AF1198